MGSPAKPFACTAADCSMRFTNEDHLNVHTRKHDLELQLAMGHKAAVFPADQTPTPTRFIRNCEEVGLFQDLQSVNPFDEGFKRAMEINKNMLISLDSAIAIATSDDALHTPHIFPNLTDVADPNIFNLASKTTSRLSSEDAQIVKHLESSIATKMTNLVNIKDDAPNTITINRHYEIRQADYSTVVTSNDPNLIRLVVKNNEKDINVVKKDVLLTEAGKMPVISQKSLDLAIDSLTSHIDSEGKKEVVKETTQDNLKTQNNKNQSLINTMKMNMKHVLKKSETVKNEDVKRAGKKRRSEVSDVTGENYEVMLKLPSGEFLHMKADKVKKPPNDVKQKLKNALENKIKTQIESEIRSGIENKINAEIKLGQFILKVKDPETINAAIGRSDIEKNILFQIAPNASVRDDKVLLQLPQKKSIVPIVVAQPNVLIPVKKIGIPMLKHVASNKPKRGRRKRTILKVDPRTVHHSPDCDILHKVGTSCNLNCAEKVINLANIAPKPNSEVVTNVKAIKHSAPDVLLIRDKNEQLNKRPTIQNVIQVTSDETLDTCITVADATVLDASIIIPDMEIRRKRDSNDVVSDSDTALREDNGGSDEINVLAAEDKMRRESRVEAVRRYRSRQRDKLKSLVEQNKVYEQERHRLRSDLLKTKTILAALKKVFTDHCTVCASAEKIRQRFSELLDLEVDDDSG